MRSNVLLRLQLRPCFAYCFATEGSIATSCSCKLGLEGRKKVEDPSCDPSHGQDAREGSTEVRTTAQHTLTLIAFHTRMHKQHVLFIQQHACSYKKIRINLPCASKARGRDPSCAALRTSSALLTQVCTSNLLLYLRSQSKDAISRAKDARSPSLALHELVRLRYLLVMGTKKQSLATRELCEARTHPVTLRTVSKGAKKVVLGRRQVVRHRILVPTFKGSTPFAPEVTHRKVFLLV